MQKGYNQIKNAMEDFAMKKNNIYSKLLKIIPYILVGLSLLLNLIIFSLPLPGRENNLWTTASPFYNRDFVPVVCLILIVFFFIQCLGYILSVISFFFKKKHGIYIIVCISIIFIIMLLFFHIFFSLLSIAGIIMVFLNLFCILGAFGVLIYQSMTKDREQEEEEIKPAKASFSKKIVLYLSIASFIALFTTFFIPLYTTVVDGTQTSFTLIDALTNGQNNVVLYSLFTFMFALIFSSFIYFLFSISYFIYYEKIFFRRSKQLLYFNLTITFVFFLMGYFSSFYFNINGIRSSSFAFIPFLLLLGIGVAHSIFQGRYLEFKEKSANQEYEEKKYKLEPLLFVIILTVITFCSLFFNIVEVEFIISSIVRTVKVSGIDLLSDYGNLGSGFQVLAFVLFSFLFSSFVMLVISAVSYFGKYKDYYKVIKVSAFANVIFMFLIGMFGIYYQISQKINEDNVESLFASLGITIPVSYSYDIKSQTLYVFLLSLVVLLIMIARKQLNYSIEPQYPSLDSNEKTSNDQEPLLEPIKKQYEFDSCPVFTEIDQKLEQFEEDLLMRKENQYEDITLPELVRFIVDYARESRLHLSYSLNDIATFVAGLGASRLSILQGMSGTGKTSLPKIFVEAIMGNCEIIEVESSWRDKNELIGYYNEFSKVFTPKKFTQSLYRAKLNPEIPTFIVLDEMNLSRIEYYFSDFLSLMENEENKRKIQLLNVNLYKVEEGERKSYLALEEGHTLRIPTNVWFIGTANRDESTFEISDKVYDRAQTMNFNKRAPRIPSYNKEIPPKFLSYSQLAMLLENAKQSMEFNAEDHPLVRETEAILAPYNISFGNRILKQMEDFVKIYCSCFGEKEAVLNEALEKILLSKVVSKLEYKNIEDKEDLIQEFERLSLHACSEFVRRLNED